MRTNLSLDTYRNGYLSVKGVAGTISTHSQHCDISLMNISGTATAFSYNGDLTVEFECVDEDADLDFESYNGSIDLTLPGNIQATTAVSAGRGTFGSMFEIAPIERSSDPRLASLDESTASRINSVQSTVEVSVYVSRVNRLRSRCECYPSNRPAKNAAKLSALNTSKIAKDTLDS